jgi:CBS domain-containing protein
METSIMTEKLARRGTVVRPEYAMDFLSQVLVREVMSTELVTLRASESIREARAWLASHAAGSSHQGYPVLDDDGRLVGVVTRRDLLSDEVEVAMTVRHVVRRQPVVVHGSTTLREAADHMVRAGVGRLPVVDPETAEVVGILSRSDLLAAHERRLRAAQHRSEPRFERKIPA